MSFRFSFVNRIFLTPFSALMFLGWVFFLVSSGALPDPVAIHWGLTGEADGFVPRDSYLQIVAPAILVPWALQILFCVLLRKTPLIRSFIQVTISIIYWLLFFIIVLATAAQLDVLSASESRFPIFLIALLLVFIPASLWFALSFPSIELGENLVIRLRGIKVLTIPMKQVQSVQMATLSPWNFGGLGIRVAGKTLAFIPGKGEGVIFLLASGERIAVRSKDAVSVSSNALARLGE